MQSHLSLLLTAFAFAVISFIAGLYVLRRGLRGKTIDDHPLCRRCGFDLTGKPAESTTCSECGADLSVKNAIVIGHRQGRVGFIRLAVVMLLFGGVVGMTSGLTVFRRVEWVRYEPLPLLKYLALHASRATAVDSLLEISRRVYGGALNRAELDSIIATALAEQADTSKPWQPLWGQIVEGLHERQSISTDRWQQYIRQAMPTLSLRVRPIVARGDRVPYELVKPACRVSGFSRLQMRLETKQLRLLVDDLPLSMEHNGASQSVSGMAGAGNLTAGAAELWPTQKQLKSGKHTLRLVCPVEIQESYGDIIDTHLVFDCDVSATFDYRPEGQRDVAVNGDETLRLPIEQALSTPQIALDPVVGGQRSITLKIATTSVGPPIGLAYEAVLRSGEREWKASTFIWRVGEANQQSAIRFRAEGFDLAADAPVDLVLKPSVKAATETIDLREIWGGEIRFQNVKVTPAGMPIQ